MEQVSELPCPFVTAKQLNTMMQKTVMVAGKVITATDSTILLDSGEDKKITVYRSKPFLVHVEVGMNVLIRGTVNPDLSIAESKDFPPSDVGERFGT